MLTDVQPRDTTLFDSDPAYNDMASVFAPVASTGTNHRRHLAPPPPDRASRGAVASIFALVAMLAGLVGLVASRYVMTPQLATTPATTPRPVPLPVPLPVPMPVRAEPQPAPPTPSRRTTASPPIRLALSHPPVLPPITPRKTPRVMTPTPAASALAAAPRSQRTPHLTGAALARALAQDVIDTRKLNDGILRNGAAARATVPSSDDTR